MTRTAAAGALIALASLSTVSLAAPNRPKLVLLISIDQFRADYIDRFEPYFLPAKTGGKLGGFRFIEETGARYTDAHHNHVPTATGPGHATLMTGSEPCLDGIVGNSWFDRETGKPIYCVDDPSVQPVGPGGPMSPRNLRVTTVGDELKMATNGRSKVVGISFKDRAAILMAGHAADSVVWMDESCGGWVTSTFYAPNGRLPVWADAINREHWVARADNESWEPLLPIEAYSRTRKAPAEAAPPAGKAFSHRLGSGKPDPGYIGRLIQSGQGQTFLFDTVERAIDAENLGRHEDPDILVVNLATNDYIGHRYGPNSPEVMDITVRTDRLLSRLFNDLDKRVGIDNVAITITGDHGVLPIPEESNGEYRTGSSRVLGSSVATAVQAALTAAYGEGRWVVSNGTFEDNLYLNRKLIADKKLPLPEVEEAAAKAASGVPGIYCAFGADQIMHGELPAWDWDQKVVNGYDPKNGGDVLVFEAPGVLFGGGTGTGHGSPWAYDSHVPILMRWGGIARGVYSRTVATADIAPTLCRLLGIEQPTGNVGHPLYEALGTK